jgi:hypothetical protein
MPTWRIYIRTSKIKLTTGGIIVFYLRDKNSNLLKYVAAHEGDEYCLDFESTLWVKGFPVAQKSIAKYHGELPTQSPSAKPSKKTSSWF